MTSTLTPRVSALQRPIFDDLSSTLSTLESLAAAIDDNAWDSGTPIPQSLILTWDTQLARIRRNLRNAGLATTPPEAA